MNWFSEIIIVYSSTALLVSLVLSFQAATENYIYHPTVTSIFIFRVGQWHFLWHEFDKPVTHRWWPRALLREWGAISALLSKLMTSAANPRGFYHLILLSCQWLKNRLRERAQHCGCGATVPRPSGSRPFVVNIQWPLKT